MSRPGSPVARLGVAGEVTTVGIVGACAALIIAIIAVVNVGKAEAAADGMRTLEKAHAVVQDVRFANGDVSGWQLGAAWQANKVGGAFAADPNQKYRKNFLAGGADLKKKMATLSHPPAGRAHPGGEEQLVDDG